ncbi:MAG: hypothetical protein K8T10_17575 [Candidatus Eremiobacteraeota bacterium]|nr:hypothetical protein [Candidatus Eremiobacteraeota bacterium]
MHIEKTGQTHITNNQKKAERKSVSRMPIDSFVKSTGGEKEFQKIDIKQVFFDKGDEITDKFKEYGYSEMSDLVTGEKVVTFRANFDHNCKKGESYSKVIPAGDGTFSFIREQKDVKAGDAENKYYLVKANEDGSIKKEIFLQEAEDFKNLDIQGSPDGRVVVITEEKYMCFSPDGKESWSKKRLDCKARNIINFSPDGTVFIMELDSDFDGKNNIISAVNPDGGIRWKKQVSSSMMDTDEKGNLYVHDFNNSYNVIHTDGTGKKPIVFPENLRIESLKVETNGKVIALCGSVSPAPSPGAGMFNHDSGKSIAIYDGFSALNPRSSGKNKQKSEVKTLTIGEGSATDIALGDAGSFYVINNKAYLEDQIVSYAPDGKIKWQIDLPLKLKNMAKTNVNVGKDGNIYLSINKVDENGDIPDSYKKAFPPDFEKKGNFDFKGIKSLVVCISPDGKALYQHKIEKDKFEKNKPAFLANGDVVLVSDRDKVHFISRDLEKTRKTIWGKMEGITQDKTEAVERKDKKEEGLTIKVDKKKKVVDIGGVKLQIK